jgi:hypothetical protein
VVSGEWTVWPRNANLTRSGDPITWWSELVHVDRYNLPNTWTLTGPAPALLGFQPGMGCILDRDGVQVDSGNVREVWRNREQDPSTGRFEDRITVAFSSDKDVLWSRLCFPDPSHDLTSTVSKFAATHDVRSGSREAILLGYVGANAGPAAPITRRRVTGLTLPASLGRGGSTSYRARMAVLGDVVAELGEAANLAVNVQHDETSGSPRLALTVDNVPDVSSTVVFGPPEVARATGWISGLEYRLAAPEATDAVVFAAGEMTDRWGARYSDEDAVTLWARRREVLVDQRQTDDASAIQDAGTGRLAEGASPVALSFSVTDTADVQAGRDYRTGWRVGFETPELPAGWVLDNRVRELQTTVNADGETRQATVGTPGATVASTKQARLLARVMSRLAAIEGSL